ncbi:aldo/keto reductase [Conexibacter sp. JD483]|uniref:aldo/keto reductase n=1 Tax=unclassified Conexibacter TaxID=2627773 RepID=UPI00271C185A|nr:MULTISPECIES: aldo/keto reductase [unclassified Conexibacter]MDO8185191.1 aldo/keto reductase [Conexibacter sp. CPCC 205706]MDO8198237.1 aldo/keto reductase [Conexibacter sp. CPCC 205762]MDR9367801.1 aldo/keto reductase [Conexibacter sp. JD483]
MSRFPAAAFAASPLGFGAAALGNLYEPLPDDAADSAVAAAIAAGVRCFDVAPLYGSGLAEERLGAALGTALRTPAVTISTKVGRLLRPRRDGDAIDPTFAAAPARTAVPDFSRDGVRRSLEGSLRRLGVERVDVVYLHDPEPHWRSAVDEALPALCELRDEGLLRAIGVGTNVAATPARLFAEAEVDCVLLAGQYTLLEHADGLAALDAAAARGVAVVAAGVFNSGILAAPGDDARFGYAPAPAGVLARARRIAAICAEHGVALPAAALRLPLAHPAVAGVLVGMRSATEVRADVAHLAAPIPAGLWQQLRAEELLDARLPLPA